ncbi:MAG: type IX secretion system membrane protein PorP/SprF, partial [Paramuribaculum sp.]|nr:type IX secretion system membrane protein PorP/SprF [Paramuribaculum sp.]
MIKTVTLSSHLRRNAASLLALLFMLGLTVPGLNAQTDAQFTQYFEVPSYYNPAAIGNSDFIRIRGVGRMQWVGIDNAPQNFVLTGNMPVKLGKRRLGVGLVMESGSEGLFSNISIDAQGAWQLPLFKKRAVLSIGFNIGYRNQKFKG